MPKLQTIYVCQKCNAQSPTRKPFLIFFTLLLALFLFSPIFVFAQESKSVFDAGVPPTLQMPIPGAPEFSKITAENGYLNVPWLAEYIAGIYKYAIALAVSLAIFMVMVGGFLWITAAGDKGKIGKATEIITDAVVGLILAVGSYLILYTINPDLVSFEALKVKMVEAVPWEPVSGLGAAEDVVGQPAGLSGKPGLSPTKTGADRDVYRLTSCDGLAKSGKEFEAYFTHYYAADPNNTTGFHAPRTISCTSKNCLANPGPELTGNYTFNGKQYPWAFLCAVGMQCSCPGGKIDKTKRCYSGKEGAKWSPTGDRQGWFPCEPFDPETTTYCGKNPGGTTSDRYRSGETVAADKDCFYVKAGCKILVDGQKEYEITDSGSGIRGLRFDVFTSGKGDDGGVKGGVHKVKILNPDVCRSVKPYRGGNP